ncbi:hypothetical protein ACFQ9X_03030 [Catenulispora yoronensis]
MPIAWGAGAAVMTAAVVWPSDPVAAAVAGSLIGPAVVAAAMGVGVVRGVSAPVVPTDSAANPTDSPAVSPTLAVDA